FAITFLGLGALLGWYTHAAYVSNSNKNTNVQSSVQIEKKISIDNNVQPYIPVSSKTDSIETQFTRLIEKNYFDQALQVYKDISPEMQTKLFLIIRLQVDELNKELDPAVLSLLDVFLQEYYDNTQLLIMEANALLLRNETEQALSSFLLARSYAKNNDEYIAISQQIHEFSKSSYKEFVKEKAWLTSINFFIQLIENEPNYPFYHLCLAESYIKLGEDDKAITPLQWIMDDIVYGEKATELLDIITLNRLSAGIELDKKGEQYIASSILSDIYEVKLLIDTGASYSSLPSLILKQLVQDQQAEKVGRNQIQTAGGLVEADIYKVKKMAIGAFYVNDIMVTELDLYALDGSQNDIIGLLGMNFLSRFYFTIDQKSQQLFLTPKLN
ncbi:MAG: retroviral-like aspartic protease family protein, partial [gamma proteobacterium symbiont of Lucinoma myriamae]|nr:retroviral-like aspartic protease family protein [gamma proteobacterium symbiont of Lucinoma myriamae]